MTTEFILFGIKEIEPSTKGVRTVSVMITALIQEK